MKPLINPFIDPSIDCYGLFPWTPIKSSIIFLFYRFSRFVFYKHFYRYKFLLVFYFSYINFCFKRKLLWGLLRQVWKLGIWVKKLVHRLHICCRLQFFCFFSLHFSILPLFIFISIFIFLHFYILYYILYSYILLSHRKIF